MPTWLDFHFYLHFVVRFIIKLTVDPGVNNVSHSNFLPSKDYLVAIIICIVLLLVAFMFVIIYVGKLA